MAMKMIRIAVVFCVVANALDHSAEDHVIVDCDPAGLTWSGLDVDDDLAILSLLAAADGCGEEVANSVTPISPIKILGITTCAGNAPQRHTFADASFLVRRLNLPSHTNQRIPVVQGASWWPPFASTWRSRTPTDASRFIVETVMDSPPRSVTVLALGPLTNVAQALQSENMIADRLKRIVIMGGDLSPTHLDLNFLSDAHAANIVLGANARKTLVPVQV